MNNEYVYLVIKLEFDNEKEYTSETVDTVYYDSDDAYNYVDEQREYEVDEIKYRVDRHRVVFKENTETFSGAERMGLEKAAKIAEKTDGYGMPVWADGPGIAAEIRSRTYVKK